MKVAVKITIATALVVTLSTALYSLFDVRSQSRERDEQIEQEARNIAFSLRVGLESRPAEVTRDLARDAETLSRDLSRATAGWRVDIVPRAQLSEVPTNVAANGSTPARRERELRRLHALIDVPKLAITERDDDEVRCSVPIRGATATTPNQNVDDNSDIVGMIEVTQPTARLRLAMHDDALRAILLVLLISLATTVAVGLVASNLVSRPIRKLLRGVDDVAKGDLSHVLLSEREDEIGQLATRFNEMTFSLRESRAETSRQNQAKLDLEQRLGQTEKLATLGQLAAEIAHEIGTPLNVIAGRARATERKASEVETVTKNATIIAEQAARITKIIQRLLDFARRKVGAPEHARVNLNEVTLTTMELLGTQFANAKVKTRLARAEALPWVAGDADRLQQVVINLVLNATQAMPDGGNLTVETSTTVRARPGLDDAPAQTFVCVSVTDSGGGIDEAIREKIFDPFYTTKEGQGGTGLGLAVCSGIVKEHDGWIDVDDAQPRGTVFRVYLPVSVAVTAKV